MDSSSFWKWTITIYDAFVKHLSIWGLNSVYYDLHLVKLAQTPFPLKNSLIIKIVIYGKYN